MLIPCTGKCSTTKVTVSGQVSQRALSVPLTFDHDRRKHSRLANQQNFDAIALGRFDANIAGARVLSDVSRTGLSNPSGVYMMLVIISDLHLFQAYSLNRMDQYLTRDAPHLVNVRCRQGREEHSAHSVI
jgi:hypothetical protein